MAGCSVVKRFLSVEMHLPLTFWRTNDVRIVKTLAISLAFSMLIDGIVAGAETPNVVLILSDDVGTGDIKTGLKTLPERLTFPNRTLCV